MSINAPDSTNLYFDFISKSAKPPEITEPPVQKKRSALAVFYINDIHAQLSKASRLKTASDSFTRVYENNPQTTDTFKLSAGDSNIGNDYKKNKFVVQLLNMIGIRYSAVGNHEFDDDTANLSNCMDDANYKYVCSNIDVSKDNPLTDNIKKQELVKSWVEVQNNNKYGFVGVTPVDLKSRISPENDSNKIDVENLDETVKSVQQEVNNLKKQGVNRIILVSHFGIDNDIKLAERTSGIDIVIGGHSHDVLDGLNTVKGLDGEPVIITQAGKDGNYFGILNVIYDDKDNIVSADNVVHNTDDFEKDRFVEYLEENLIGAARPIGVLTNITYPKNISREENPMASFMADSMRYKLHTQIAFVNSGNLRGTLEPGTITTRSIQDLIPFNNRLCVVELSEKDIIDTLNYAAQSTEKEPFKPGVMQVSGLKYTITPQKTVKDVFVENSDGSYTQLNDKSPDNSRKFTVAYDSFMQSGAEGLSMLKKTPIKTYDFDKTETTIEYIEEKFKNKPFEIKSRDRIKIENN